MTVETPQVPTTDPRTLRHALGWVPIGVLVCIGVLAIFSIGSILLLIAGFLIYRRTNRRPNASLLIISGLLAGASVGPFLIAFQNREGPGYICTTTATSISCGEQTNPWIGVGIGVALLVLAAVIFLRARRTPAS